MIKLLSAFAASLALAAFPGSTRAKTIFKDLFVFRTGNAVYSLETLKNYSLYLKDLSCFYPESLAAKHFESLYSAPKGFFNVDEFKQHADNKYAHTTKNFISLVKMVRYASSQSVSVSSSLPKAFRLSAEKSGCSLRGFEGNELKEEMKRLAMVEVFLRSRFAPGGETLKPKRKAEILKNIQSLEDSVQNQIEHELFSY